MNFVFACDEPYAMQLATTMRSIVDANPRWWPLSFHVLVEDFSTETRRKIEASLGEGSASFAWIPVDMERFREFRTLTHVSRMTFARLAIPHVLPESVARVLYLDADLLVLQDIEALWRTDLEGAVVGAVLDVLVPSMPVYPQALPLVRSYFNAGVLLIDLPLWRRHAISERALKYLTQHPETPFSDQDALNVVCDGRWKKLDARWNFQEHFEQRILDLSPPHRPAIVHFVSNCKPWDPTSASVNASLYEAFRARTRFAQSLPAKYRSMAETAWHRLKRRLWQHALFRVCWRGIKKAARLWRA